MKFAVLVFCMNSLEVTSMVFRDIETGLKKVKELTGRDMEQFLESGGKEGYTMDVYDEMNGDGDPHFADKFFTGYYPGCGEAGWMVLKEVEEGTLFCEWDLD